MLSSPRKPSSTILILPSTFSLNYNSKSLLLVLTGDKKWSEHSLDTG